MSVAASNGDVTGEYLALRRETGVVIGSHELVWVTGPDAEKFLEGLVSQELGSVASGGAVRSLLLSPQGKLRATLWMLRSDDGFGLVVDSGIGAAVIEDLLRFKIRVDAAIDAVPGTVDAVIGPAAEQALGRVASVVPGPGVWVDEPGGIVANLPMMRAVLPRFLVSGAPSEQLVDGGVVRSGRLAFDTVRIEAGEPVMNVDLDERTIPQEAGVVDGAVSFTKGCYLGQELVARIDSRGHVNRHLRGIVIGSNVLPPVGATVVAAGKELGSLTTVGESLDLRAPVALALIRREAEPGAEVEVTWDGGSAPAVVKELPLLS